MRLGYVLAFISALTTAELHGEESATRDRKVFDPKSVWETNETWIELKAENERLRQENAKGELRTKSEARNVGTEEDDLGSVFSLSVAELGERGWLTGNAIEDAAVIWFHPSIVRSMNRNNGKVDNATIEATSRQATREILEAIKKLDERYYRGEITQMEHQREHENHRRWLNGVLQWLESLPKLDASK